MGGDKYLQVRSQVSRGRYSQIRDGMVVSYQSFVDAIVFPDKERTEFRGQGSRSTQVNTGDTGWVYDGDQEVVRDQTPVQIANFRRGIRVSLDSLLRGYWKGKADLSYVGKRPGTLGRRNDVVRLTYADGFIVEFEFAEDGTPQKAIYTRGEGEDAVTEEDRYGQFVDVGGAKAPFVIDRFTGGKHSSRINFETIEPNKSIPGAAFARPANAKEAKRNVKF